MPAPLSIIIPTLNAADALPATSDALLSGATDGLIRDLVVSDGGSTDPTREIARELGALWVEGPKGRGGQIARGTNATEAPWLLILHADTWLSDGWTDAVRAHMNATPGRAGYFRLAFRSDAAAGRLVAAAANIRARRLGLPYGDQGLLLSRDLLDRVGGFPEIPLMEDVEMARRLKGNLIPLAATAHTSADRYETQGWIRRSLHNLGTLARYRLGASPEKLLSRYGR